ncbi:MAG TPA: type II secretion system minor pseudopilin GspK [Paucimonas sp.]|nr:type II secretion system minor pseudopilin GspK [Paucimonas sp.]HJW54000.1 type II secretion system minor pseudopilin GspK [Burkholderiaceae bacterium]
MRIRPCVLDRQRGVAVITALLLTTLAVTIVASLFWQQQVQVRSIENQRLQLQKQWILRGALDWARLILREDARDSRTSRTDNLDEPWAVPLEETRLDQYIENGHADTDASDAALSGGIIDAQSRFNLANLCVNGAINQREVNVFAQLLSNVHADPTLAQAAADLMAAAQGGAAATAPDASRPLTIRYAEDLLAVPGFSAEAFDKVRDFVVVLPRPTPINLNTAPTEVLAARIDTLSVSDAAALVASRAQAYFRTKADLVARLPGKQLTLNDSEVSVSTSFFIVNGNVRLSRASLQVHALIERRGAASTQVIWIRED